MIKPRLKCGSGMALLFLVSLPYYLTAVTHIPGQQWQQIVQDKAFGYKDSIELQAVSQTPPQNNALSKLIAVIAGLFSNGLGKSIVWICLFLLVAYFLYKLFWREKLSFFQSKKKEHNPENEIIPVQGMMDTDWEKMKANALARNDLKLATRCVYMHLLQLLQQKKIINYTPDKTNQEYYYELRDENLKRLFRQLTRQYEFVWYGDYPIKEGMYENYIEIFQGMKDRIS